MKYLKYVPLLVFLSSSVQAQEECDSVLKFTGNNLYKSFSSSKLEDIDFFFKCTEEGKGRSGNLGVGYAGFELKVGGSSYNTQQDCEEKNREIDSQEISEHFTSEVAQIAVEAWLQCKTAKENNIDIDINEDTGGGFTIGFRNNTGNDLEVRTRVFEQNISTAPDSCYLIVPAGVSLTDESPYKYGVLLDRKKITYDCNRPTKTENRDGFFVEYQPSFSIKFITSEDKDFTFIIPEKIKNSAALEQQEEMQGAIARLEEQLTSLRTLEQTNTNKFNRLINHSNCRKVVTDLNKNPHEFKCAGGEVATGLTQQFFAGSWSQTVTEIVCCSAN